MTGRRRIVDVVTYVEIIAKTERVMLHKRGWVVRCTVSGVADGLKTDLFIVVVVDAGCARASNQQWPPQSSTQQPKM